MNKIELGDKFIFREKEGVKDKLGYTTEREKERVMDEFQQIKNRHEGNEWAIMEILNVYPNVEFVLISEEKDTLKLEDRDLELYMSKKQYSEIIIGNKNILKGLYTDD